MHALCLHNREKQNQQSISSVKFINVV